MGLERALRKQSGGLFLAKSGEAGTEAAGLGRRAIVCKLSAVHGKSCHLDQSKKDGLCHLFCFG
jgi:hypothetical protein